MRKRLLSILLTAALLISLFPAGAATVAHAAESVEKTTVDESTFDALGFGLNKDVATDRYLGPGNTTMSTKNELYMRINGSSHYGWILRENLNLNHPNWSNYGTIGAYRLYGQYKNGDWAKLTEGNGYTYGQTGGQDSVLGSWFSSGSHQNRAYETATEYRSATGKVDRVAKLYVTASTNRIEYTAKLQIMKLDENGDGTYSDPALYTVTVNPSSIYALDEAGSIFNQYFDALFDIAAGDFNGDGVEDIAVYYGDNAVRIYTTKNDKLSLWKTINFLDEGILNSDIPITDQITTDSGATGKTRAAVVTLAAGDLKKDFTDDLVITVSMPQGATEKAHQTYPAAYIYGINSDDNSISASEFTQDLKIPLVTDNLEGDKNKPQVFKAANATIGDLDGDKCMDLVIGGRLCSKTGLWDTSWNKGGLIPVRYDHKTNQYSVGAVYQTSLNEYDEDKILTNAHNGDLRYLAPAAMAIADLDGVGSSAPQLFFFAELFNYDASNSSFSATGQYLDTIKNQTNNVNKSAKKSQHWISDVVVGNFNDNESGAQQILAVVGCKESGEEWYYYYLSYIAMHDGTISAQCEGIINQARSYLNQSEKGRATPYVSIAAPDVDDDGILLKYKSTELVYTKPEVQAILQSAPYFQDVADSRDNYLNNGATAYGTVAGSAAGETASVEASLGVCTQAEVSIGVAAEIESTLAVTTSYDHATVDSVETSVEYAGAVGDDYVVMYTIPYHRYIYDATYPDGTTSVMVIEEPMTPATVIVPVDTYDGIAAVTQGLEPIRGNLLTSTPGDPSSYQTPPSGDKWITIGNVQALTNAGSGGSTVTVSQTASTEKEHSFSVGIEESLTMTFGVGAAGNNVKVGFDQGFAVSGGGVYSNMEGVAYTGTVDNLPAGVTGYGFNWQLGISEAKLNGEDIIIVGYQTSNVKQAPSMPGNLNVSDITNNTITLEWNTAADAALYEVYVSRDQDTWLPLDPVPATMADNVDAITYTVKDLSPGTTYYFKVNAANAYGVRSLDSEVVIGTTLGNAGSFSIVSQPQDTSAAKGRNATFSVSVSSDSSSTIHYQWMYQENGKWINISGSNSPVLTVENVTEDMDGRVYRCRISQSANYFYSQGATLTVSKSPSSVELTISKDGATLANGSVVQATSVSTEDVTQQVTVWKDVVVNGYTKVTPNAFVTEAEDGSYTYSSNAVYFWMDANGDVYAVGENNTVGNLITTYFSFATVGDGEDAESSSVSYITGSTAESVDAVTIPDVGTSTKFYAPKDEGGAAVYLVEGTDEEGGTFTTYYVHTVTGEGDDAEDVYTQVNMDAELIYVDETAYLTNDLDSVKSSSTETIVIGQNTITTDGDVLTLTATGLPSDLTSSDKVSFQIINLSNGSSVSIPATKSGNNWTAAYTFTATGSYEIVAVYSGNNDYFSSRSNPMVLYVNGATATMNLNGGTMTYGDSLHLTPTIHSAAGTTAPSDVTYTVTKDGEPQNGLISSGVFTPAETGTYSITASCEVDGIDYAASAQITVQKRTLTITAQPVTASLNDSEEQRQAMLHATVTGLLAADSDLLSYTLSSDATTATTQGSYRINVNVSDFDSKLGNKYSLVTFSDVFTLEQSSIRVSAKAVSNGEVSVSYTTTVSDSNGTYTSSPLTVESGTLLPGGATVVITAKPNNGFGVEKWSINGVIHQSTDTTYVIDNLQTAQDITVYFTQAYSILNFSGSDGGTVTGNYTGSATSFNSGDRINVNQSVVLTATPAEGYVVSYWSRDGEIIKAANGVDNYTGTTCTVSGVSQTTTYYVVFEKEETVDVKVSFEDKDGYIILGAGASVNGEAMNGEGNTFTYTAAKHENLTIELDIPSNMLVDHWELNGKVAADAVEILEVYDLTENVEYIVYCTTPNQRVLTYGAELIDTNGGTLEEAGTVIAARSGDAVESGTSLPQSAVITLTAQAAEGYRVAKWTVNGSQVAGVGTESYQLVLDQNSDVKVYFEKQPIITVTEPVNGSVNLQVGPNGVDSGSCVEFGDDVQINITPDVGYVVDTVTVNDTDVTALLSASGDIRYYIVEDIAQNTTISATFKAKPIVTFTETTDNGNVTVTATKDFAEGTIESGSYVDFGSMLQVTVDPAEGYIVDTVTVGDAEAALTAEADSDTVTFTVSDVCADTAMTITYKHKPVVTVTETTDNGDVTVCATKDFTAAEIESGSYVDFGCELTGMVSPEKGYVVESVTMNGEAVAISAVNDSDDVTFSVANIQADTQINVTYAAIDTIAVSFGIVDKNGSENEGGLDGTITASVSRKNMEAYAVANDDTGMLDPVYSGSTVTFTAVPNDGYKVSKWFVNGEEVSEQPVLTVTDDMADQLVQVQFDMIGEGVTYAITGQSDKAELTAIFTPEGGVAQDFTSGNQPTTQGVITVSVENLDPNYTVEGWYVNGEKQEGQTGLTFEYAATVDEGAEITVNLIRCSYTVTFSATEGTVTAAIGEYAIASGDVIVGDTEVTFTAAAREETGYTFMGWYVNGELSDVTEETLTITLTENVDVQAVYRLDFVRYTVTFGVVDTNGETDGGLNGTLALQGYRTSPARVRAGSNLDFIAAPAEDYRVEGWYADAEGTLPISGTDVEQLTYSTENLVADMTVYVKFEPIPEYTIDLTVTGLGSVAATVNGVPAEFAEGKLTVQRYDDVVLTAIPDDNQYLTGWTLDGQAQGNELTLTLTSVTTDFTVAADFAPSQAVDFRTEVIGGTMDVVAGFEDNLKPIYPATGIVLNKGENIVMTVTPDEGKMLDKWIVNGEEIVDHLEHTLVIEAIAEDTVVRVEFVDEVLHEIAAADYENERYQITGITEIPEEYGTDRQIRDRGDVTFLVEPIEPFVITELAVDGGEGSDVQVIPNEDGTWTVTVENVKGDITLTKITYASCFYRTEEELTSGGTYILTLGGNEVGIYTFNQVENGWTIRAEDGTYLAVSGTTLVHTDSAYTWTYSNGCFSATVKSKSNSWWGNWWGSSSSTTYYLVSSGNTVTVSTSKTNAAAAFFTEHEDELHTFRNVVTAPTCTEDGFTTHTCVNCGYTFVNEKTDALGHNYEEVVTAPTCTEGGSTTHTCANCGDSYVTDRTEALGHEHVAGETVAPTCTQDGYTVYTCSRCGDSYRGDPISALGHNFEDGSCTRCGEPEEDECVYLESKTLVSGETYILILGGNEVGTYTFVQVSGGWTIQLEDGTYLALKDNTLVNSDKAFTWTYSNGRFSTTVTTASGGGWWGKWWGSGSSSTTYYLASSGSNVIVSTSSSAAAAAFYQKASGDHVYGDPVAADGFHIFTCGNCGHEKTEICQNPDCELCHPVIPEAIINVSVRITNSTSGGGWWGKWWGSGSGTTYTATITVTAENTEVESVAYSTNGGSSWTTGTSFTSNSEINAFEIRVTATNGATYYFQYADGTVTPVA